MHNHDHGHSHSHSHAGHHHHHVSPEDVASRAFIVGIVLNSAYIIVQAVTGFMTHSMAMLSDAGHNLSDVAALGLSLLSFRLARAKPTLLYSYGFKKTTILAALTNAVILLVTIGMLGYESILRIMHPQPVEGGIVAIVAGVGIVINLASALLFFRNKAHDLNTRGAYLHMLTDALVSLGVVVAGVVIRFTNWYWLDGATSVVILIVILISTWSLLTHSLRLTLDAVPVDIEIEKIEKMVLQVKGVESMHHTHIWAMSTTQNALTAHLVLNEALSFEEKMKIVHHVKHELLHNNIHHATLELESADMPCIDSDC